MLDKKEIREYIKELKPIPTELHPKGSLPESIRCILFDIYGTLFISASGDFRNMRFDSGVEERLQELLDLFRLKISPKDLVERIEREIEQSHAASGQKGIDFPEVDIAVIWTRILGDLGIKRRESILRFAVKYELLTNPVYPMPDLELTLSFLHEKGIRLGIISNAQFYTPMLFEWFPGSTLQQLGFDMDLVLLSYRFGIAKPSPYLFEKAANRAGRYGIERNEILYVGNDMLNDICPAAATGMRTALFAGDRRSLRLRESHPLCQKVTPDIILTQLRQLMDHI